MTRFPNSVDWCPRCHGSGEYGYAPNPDRKCPRCRGAGIIRKDDVTGESLQELATRLRVFLETK